MAEERSQGPSIRRIVSRVLLGIMLAGAVYYAAESLGLGSRRARAVVFVLDGRPAQIVEVTYLAGDEVARQAALRVVDIGSAGRPALRARDEPTLPEGRYELEILIVAPDDSRLLERRAVELGEPDEVRVDISD